MKKIDPKQIAKGIKEETKEHGKSFYKYQILKIVMDHLKRDKNYYMK